MHITLVGAGNMGGALLDAWVNDPSLSTHTGIDNLTVIDPNLGTNDLPSDAQVPIDLVPSPADIDLSDTDVLILAVKPQVLPNILSDYNTMIPDQALVISLAAGVTIAGVQSHFTSPQPILRAMPNMPAQVGAGMTAVFANKYLSDDQMQLAKDLFKSVGRVIELKDEDQFHAVTALSGSGPGYLFKMVVSMAKAGAKGGVRAGLPEGVADQLARQTMIGAGRLLEKSDQSANDLAQAVTSPGGTTEAGLNILSDRLDDLIHDTIQAAINRSIQLSESPDS